MTKVQADQAVANLLLDLTDRRGLRQEWEQIDEEIQDEIRRTWSEITQKAGGKQ